MRERRRDLENWQEDYKRKLVSYEEAARAVKSGDNVFIPNTYLGKVPQAIADRQKELRDVTIEIQCPNWTREQWSPSPGPLRILLRSRAHKIETFLKFKRKGEKPCPLSFMRRRSM